MTHNPGIPAHRVFAGTGVRTPLIRAASETVSTPAQPRGASHMNAGQWLLVVALLFTGLSMRTAVTSVGAVLADISAGLHANSATAGLITTLPALCFAIFGAMAPRMATRAGPHRLLLLSLAAMAIGLAARALVGNAWAFIALSVVGLVGSAVANVLMPTLVKWHFPNRIGSMTALYTTAMAIGTTAGAGVTVPIGSTVAGPDEWRVGIGSWALLAALAAIPWVSTVRHDNHFVAMPRMPASRLIHSRTAWMVALFFAFQSIQAYIIFGWFERFLTAHAIADDTAGWMVALLSAMGIPVSMIAPNVPKRYHRLLLVILGGCYAVAYLGMIVAPASGAWLWMVLAGIGGGMFPLSLALMGFRSASPETTASLSAFAQGIGYTIAACGPILFGVLHGATGGWNAPFAILWLSAAAAVVTGWAACAPRTVDEDLSAPRSAEEMMSR